jgi:hypothetical protein
MNMSASGQKQTSAHVRVMSALPPEADIRVTHRHVRYGPEGDIKYRSTGSPVDFITHVLMQMSVETLRELLVFFF